MEATIVGSPQYTELAGFPSHERRSVREAAEGAEIYVIGRHTGGLQDRFQVRWLQYRRKREPVSPR